MSYRLSKSSFIRGLQCEKSLYLDRYGDELRNPIDDAKEATFERGRDVGKLAQQLFPGGIDASTGKEFDVPRTIKRSKELLAENVKVIYEAAFTYDGVLVIADIVVRRGSKWDIYEVKSSNSMKDVYYNDAAIQFYVVNGAGFPVSDISIVHLNKEYVRKGNVEVKKLFQIESVLSDVKSQQKTIPTRIAEFKNVLSKKFIPIIDIGPHCSDPYDCDFSNFCWKHIPEDSVFDISGMKSKKKFELYYDGIIKIKDIEDADAFPRKQQIQILGVQKKQKNIDKKKIQQFIDTLEYPLYFMDFESFMPAVPLFDNCRPYQQIVFQYSLHYREDPVSELEHYEYLADATGDPREEFAVNLLRDTKKRGSIIVYNNSFEGPRLKELARDLPKHKKELEERISRIKDLMVPFREKAYYDPQMRGAYSIKEVLPVLAHDLDYRTLAINNGGLAMSAYEQLIAESDAKKVDELRCNLLEYCKMDTLAMVRVLEVLGVTIQ